MPKILFKQFFAGIILFLFASLFVFLGLNLDSKNMQGKKIRSADLTKKTIEKPPVGEAIKLNSLIREAKGLYDFEEMSKKEGVLWFDEKGSRYIITLGAVHGLVKDDFLSIYDGVKEIGQIKVDLLFDVISYVQISEDVIKELKNDYYRVVIE